MHLLVASITRFDTSVAADSLEGPVCDFNRGKDAIDRSRVGMLPRYGPVHWDLVHHMFKALKYMEDILLSVRNESDVDKVMSCDKW